MQAEQRIARLNRMKQRGTEFNNKVAVCERWRAHVPLASACGARGVHLGVEVLGALGRVVVVVAGRRRPRTRPVEHHEPGCIPVQPIATVIQWGYVRVGTQTFMSTPRKGRGSLACTHAYKSKRLSKATAIQWQAIVGMGVDTPFTHRR